jgi:hypothetical protein
MKAVKTSKKKSPATRKLSLRAVRLQEIRFTTSSKTNNYPTPPTNPGEI